MTSSRIMYLLPLRSPAYAGTQTSMYQNIDTCHFYEHMMATGSGEISVFLIEWLNGMPIDASDVLPLNSCMKTTTSHNLLSASMPSFSTDSMPPFPVPSPLSTSLFFPLSSDSTSSPYPPVTPVGAKKALLSSLGAHVQPEPLPTGA